MYQKQTQKAEVQLYEMVMGTIWLDYAVFFVVLWASMQNLQPNNQ